MGRRRQLFDSGEKTRLNVRGRFVEVALPTPVDRVFDYIVPDPLAEKAKVGHRVTVPFGRRSMQGFVVAEKEESTLMRHQIKKVLEAPDDEPLLNKGMLDLTKWMGEYYACSWGEALQAVLPAVVRSGRRRKLITLIKPAKPIGELMEHVVVLDAKVRSARSKSKNNPQAGERNDNYARVLRALATHVDDNFTPSELADKLGISESPIKTLVKQGWIRFEKVEPELVAGRGPGQGEGPPKQLTVEQQHALGHITASLDRTEYKTFLLFGVTGSGKTEVYIRAIEHALEHGKSAIVLVPEISLTPQTVRRFAARFENVSVLHSGLTDAERRDAWKAIREGKSRVVIGPRSALFAPVVDLGLVVIDEEHEGTYKQESTPRYHARDTAIMRCHLEHAAVILGSATPSLESWQNAQNGKYKLLELPSRIGSGSGIDGVGLAKVEVVDMAQECREQRHFTFFSEKLKSACREALAKDEQIIVFLNRRGYHTMLTCRNCGQTMMCKHCDIPMSYHRGYQKMSCHYCLHTSEIPNQCPECLSGPVKLQGLGTERVEEELNSLFYGKEISRMDSDSMKSRDDYEVTLDAFRAGETNILVGTQMIAKGLDFPNVTVVGVVSADVGMGMGDFRSFERAFQLLTQVAGRAGRGKKPGRVIVQSFQPHNEAIQCGARQDFRQFVEYEQQHRKESNYPPFSRMVLITVEARDPNKGEDEAKKLYQLLKDFEQQFQGSLMGITPPFEAPIAKLRGRHRRQIMVKARGFREVRAVVDTLRPHVKVQERIKMTIDVDPMSML
ncbi:MAG: replication restart helicase PriA [Planctomycetota bacterium]|jgi:primosomal protein N' (replication factor Y)